MTITLQETMRAVFYAPYYAALELRAYEQEGLDVRFVSAAHGTNVAHALLEGTIDVVWGGPMRVMLTNEQTAGSDLVCFCEVVTRDPFFIVGRESAPDFKLTDLRGKRLAEVSEVPTPWMCFQDDLGRAGVALDDIDFAPKQTMAENAQALRDGQIDAFQAFEPFVEDLVSEGRGHIWYAAASRGVTSYTTFYAPRQTFEARKEELAKMVRAIYRTQKWVHANDSATLAELVASYFPHMERARLASAIERYKGLGIWGQNPRLAKPGYERLRGALVSGGLVQQGASYESAVDNTLADTVIADNPPADLGSDRQCQAD